MAEMKWIPIEKGIPDKEGFYICTSKWEWNPSFTRHPYTEPFKVKVLYFGKVDKDVDTELFKDRLFKNGTYGFGDAYNDLVIDPEIVLAWMPFPEEYKKPE